jgi:hypothetical protein
LQVWSAGMEYDAAAAAAAAVIEVVERLNWSAFIHRV